MILIRLSVQRFMKGVPQTSSATMKPFQHRSPLCRKSNYSQLNPQILNPRILNPRILDPRILDPRNYITKELRKRLSEVGKRPVGELILHVDELIETVSNCKVDADELCKIQNCLGHILHGLYCEKDPKLVQYFVRMEKHNLIEENGYNVMMSYYADQMDFKNVTKVEMLQKHKWYKDVVLHSHSYVPLILDSLSLENFQHSTFYLEEMVTCMGEQFNNRNFLKILHKCTEMLTSSNKHSLETFVHQIFKVLGRYGSTQLGSELVEAIRVWFENDTHNSFHTKRTSLVKGRCRSCKRRLNSNPVTPDQLIRLKRNMTNLIMLSIIKREDQNFNSLILKRRLRSQYVDQVDVDANIALWGNSVNDSLPNDTSPTSVAFMLDIFGKLEKLLDDQGPFDVVIDAEHTDYCTDPKVLERIVKIFTNQNKNILLIWSPTMEQERMKKEVIYKLKPYCTLFVVNKVHMYAYCILYTLIHHNFNIQLVSRAWFRNHLNYLDADNMSYFQHWQKSNQYIISTKLKDFHGRYDFREFVNFDDTMQPTNSGGWHVPINDKECYCISKKIL